MSLLDQHKPESTNTVLLTTCFDNFEANLIQGRLQNEGISSFLTNENFSGLFPNMNSVSGGGTHIFVYESDYDKARSLLDETENQYRIEGNKIVCPECQSENIKIGLGKMKFSYWLLVILSLLTWTQFNNLKPKYICRDCNHEF